MTDTITAKIDGFESMILVVTGADHLELNRIDTAVRSCSAVKKQLTGWTAHRVTEHSATYIIVFKRSAHAGQHKTRIKELIEQMIPGINITFT